MSASAEDETEDDEEDGDDCSTAYDHQHPHTQLGFCRQRRGTVIGQSTVQRIRRVKPRFCPERLWPQGHADVIFPALLSTSCAHRSSR